MHMSAGRNEPCPCGSGKKYKRCCLLAEEQASRPPGQEFHDLDQRLASEIGRWAARRFGRVWETSLDAYPIEIEERKEHLSLFFAWASCERKLEGRSVASWYLEERGKTLPVHERDWLNAQSRSWLSVWEVLDVDPGKSIRLKDLLVGEERTVSEVSASQTMKPHLLVLARVVDHAGLALLIGMHPNPLLPEAGRATVAHIREEIGLGKRSMPQDLREGDRATRLIEIWQGAVDEESHRSFPRLQNTDGEQFTFVRDRFKLVGKGAREVVEAELSKLPGVQSPAPSVRERRYTVLRNNTADAVLQNTVFASIVVKARELVVETTSRQRADEMRRRVEVSVGDHLRFVVRDEDDVIDVMTEMADRPRKQQAGPEGPEIDAAMLAFKARHYGRWPDDSLPALDGLTPREAGQQPQYRARLETLLKEMEYLESQQQPGQRFDFSGIRRTLGLR